jgi:transmembrane sensor
LGGWYTSLIDYEDKSNIVCEVVFFIAIFSKKFREKPAFPVLSFMTPEQFQYLLHKYRQGLCSPEEQKLIDDWYDSIKNTKEPSLTSEEADALKNRYWLNVYGHIQRTKPGKPAGKNLLISWPAIGIAASIVFVVAAFLYLSPPPVAGDTKVAVSVPEAKSVMGFAINDGTAPKKVQLPEGSKIILQPGSKISYDPAFNKKQREIYLEGEAFFEVKRDEARPFLVYTHEVTTKVLGTSFTITARREDKNITVAVKTGRVSVYAHSASRIQSKTSETILTPNQQVVYNRTANTVSRMLVENPLAIMPADEIKRMHFEEAPVPEIFKALEKVYGVDMVFDEKLFSSCTLTTSISEEPIFDRLDIICKAIGATYSVEEFRIEIDGPGCN